MSATLSTRWYWSDWMADSSLRACGYAARGLWKDLLCIAGANKGKEYGFVTLNGRKPTDADVSRMTNGTEIEVVLLLQELELNGVFSRDRRGVIYCRRMLRAQKNASNGKLGGNPNFKKTKDNQNSVGKGPYPLYPEPEPEKKDKAPEAGLFAGADSEIPAAPPKPEKPSDWPTDYRDKFWKAFPRKTEKKSAMAKLDAIKKSGAVPWAAFAAGVNRYRHHVAGTEERFIKHPTTWLNRGCWEDEFSTTPTNGVTSNEANRNDRGGLAIIGAKLRRTVAERKRAADDAQAGFDASDFGENGGHRLAITGLGTVDRAGPA